MKLQIINLFEKSFAPIVHEVFQILGSKDFYALISINTTGCI